MTSHCIAHVCTTTNVHDNQLTFFCAQQPLYHLRDHRIAYQEESQLTDALQRRRLVNPHLPALYAELSALDAEGSLDAFGLFM